AHRCRRLCAGENDFPAQACLVVIFDEYGQLLEQQPYSTSQGPVLPFEKRRNLTQNRRCIAHYNCGRRPWLCDHHTCAREERFNACPYALQRIMFLKREPGSRGGGKAFTRPTFRSE